MPVADQRKSKHKTKDSCPVTWLPRTIAHAVNTSNYYVEEYPALFLVIILLASLLTPAATWIVTIDFDF
jgi:hypothetical protein